MASDDPRDRGPEPRACALARDPSKRRAPRCTRHSRGVASAPPGQNRRGHRGACVARPRRASVRARAGQSCTFAGALLPRVVSLRHGGVLAGGRARWRWASGSRRAGRSFARAWRSRSSGRSARSPRPSPRGARPRSKRSRRIASMALTWGAGATLAFGGALRALRHDRERGVVALARARGVGMRRVQRRPRRGTGRGPRDRHRRRDDRRRDRRDAPWPAARCPSSRDPASRRWCTRWPSRWCSGRWRWPRSEAGRARAGTSGSWRRWSFPSSWRRGRAPSCPHGWRELTSIPAALEAVRAGVQSPGSASLHGARAAVALMAVVAASLLVVHARVAIDTQRADATGDA